MQRGSLMENYAIKKLQEQIITQVKRKKKSLWPIIRFPVEKVFSIEMPSA